MRDEKGIDDLITDMDQFLAQIKQGKKMAPKIDFPVLKAEVDQFIADAEELYYITPNRHVSKKQRPKWRFMVKGYLKDIAAIPVDTPNDHEATELFVSLYDLLCEACEIYLFKTENPFASIGMEQKTLYGQLIERIFNQEISRGSIKRALQILFENDIKVDESVSYMSQVLLEHLKTVDMKKIAIEEINKMRETLKVKKTTDKVRTFSIYAGVDYEKQCTNNNYTDLGLNLYFSLTEYEEGLKYFKQYYQESDREIALYHLLNWLINWNLPEEWLTVYEQALAEGIEPRKSLQEQYDILQKNPDKTFTARFMRLC